MPEFLKLVKSNCKDCHKCIRNCSVKAIRFTGHQAHIIHDDCILCGRCYVVCPHDAKTIADSREEVKVLLQSGAPVYASLAPSFIAGFDDVSLSSMTEALTALGFTGVEETAIGATLVKREYEKQLESGERDIIISSCCPAVNSLIEKHYPELCRFLSPTVSPMVAHAISIKERHPDAKVVFIGPCIAKKEEAFGTAVDSVLTFSELSKMLAEKSISLSIRSDSNEDSRARLFPTVGGIIKTLNITNHDYTYMTVDGPNDCRAALNDIAEGAIHKCFIEMSSCSGSCIGGPVMEKYANYPIRHYQAVVKYAGKNDYNVSPISEGSLKKQYMNRATIKPMPSEERITEILRSLGKYTKEDEINCGSCGYNSCRDKAIAISRGIADPSMCLPHIINRSERFSNSIVDNSPNGIVVINDDFEIQQINKMAMDLLNVRSISDVLGENIVRILDPTPFYKVYESGKTLTNERRYYSDYKKYFEETIALDNTSKMIICILRDVTDEETARNTREELGRKTAEIADNVVEKQMRIVQEIASLLGETAAETKIALTKLKESINLDEE